MQYNCFSPILSKVNSCLETLKRNTSDRYLINIYHSFKMIMFFFLFSASEKIIAMIRIIILTVVLTIHVYGNIPLRTAIRCNYQEDKSFYLRANCSKRNFTSIPVVSPNVVVLDLSTNHIEVVDSNSFLILCNLQVLNLYFNKIEWLNQKAFLGLQKLTRLILGQNRLAYTSQQFSKYVFRPLKSLTYLDISFQRGNSKRMNFTWFSNNVISDLSNLQSIEIDLYSSPNNSVFREGFLSLTKLTNVKAGVCSMNDNKEVFFKRTKIRLNRFN